MHGPTTYIPCKILNVRCMMEEGNTHTPTTVTMCNMLTQYARRKEGKTHTPKITTPKTKYKPNYAPIIR